MRIWYRYLKEKKNVLILYFITVALFVAIGSLYHMENLDRLLYAALLCTVVWGMAGIAGGIRYVRRASRLEAAARHYLQSGELLLGKRPNGEESDLEAAESMEDAYRVLLDMLCKSQDKERRRWADRVSESRDYYATWTHQIKTPISAMKLLLDGQEFHGRDGFLMKEELLKIEQYVEMVLGFQRLEDISADLVLQEYDLYILVKQAVRKYSVLFINKGLSLELQEMELSILTDEKWFVFCVEQLLSNSIKYTVEGKISIWAEPGEKKVRLFLEDTGMGIRPEDLPRIFERGFTGYNGRLEKKSTGIGLYLCKRICTHLGIAIKMESEEGKGAKVTLSIPVEAGKME